MRTETGTYPMIAVIANGHWIPDDAITNADVLKQLSDMIGPSILSECFQEGQRVRSLMFSDANWKVTRDRSEIDKVPAIHDCDECRAYREQAVAHVTAHDDSWLAVAIVEYVAVLT